MTRRRPSTPDDRELSRVAELAELGVAAAGLLHEIRQPLFVVRGVLELARAEGRSPTAEEVTTALDQLVHLERLVDAHRHLGRRDDPVEEVPLLGLAHAATATLAPRARAMQAEVVVKGDDVRVRTRVTAVRQILSNLLTNALDAVDGSTTRTIEVHVDRATEGGVTVARLRVFDSGPGVHASVANRLFEPFVTTKPVGRGTGLGLWIARSLVEEGGGVVRAARERDRTLLEVLWPVSEAGTGGSASS